MDDLVLEGPGRRVIAIAITRTLIAVVSKGFALSCEQIRATRRYYAIPRGERYPLGKSTEAIALPELVTQLMEEWRQ